MTAEDHVDQLIEQFTTQAQGELMKGNPQPVNVRVTMIMRPEDGVWKVVHRHADPITTAQSAESITQH